MKNSLKTRSGAPSRSPNKGNALASIAWGIALCILFAAGFQSCKEDDPELSVTNVSSLSAIPTAGIEMTFNIASNVAWTIVQSEGSEEWLEIDPKSGKGNQTVTATATANTDFTTRDATLTITVKGLPPVSVTVKQAATPAPIKTVTVGAPEGRMPAGVANTFVRYPLTASGFTIENTSVINVANLPTGVSAWLVIDGGIDKLELLGNASTVAGTYGNLRLTIDGVTSDPFTLNIQHTLTGTVTLSNTTPRVGDILTATYTGGNGSGTATWEWLRNGTTIIANTGLDYILTVTAAELGNTITARVTFTMQAGYVQSAPTAAVLQPGSAADPFIVRTVEDLQRVASTTAANGWRGDAHYRQEANIDLSSVANWAPIGGSGGFSGVYDGNGYSISNLTMTGAPTDQIRGLFRSIVNGGVVRNVALRNVNITSTTAADVGGIAGAIFNNALIENCYVTGTIIGNIYVGGITGFNRGGVIQNCYSAASVTSINTTTSEDIGVGGIVGSITGEGARVSRCYALGKVTGRRYVGGIAGNLTSPAIVERSVALNSEVSITSTFDDIGRVAGVLISNPTLTANYARAAGMTLTNGSGAVTPTSSATGKHGANATAANTESLVWWRDTAGFTVVNWNLLSGRLPYLRTTTGGAFAETQNPTVQ